MHSVLRMSCVEIVVLRITQLTKPVRACAGTIALLQRAALRRLPDVGTRDDDYARRMTRAVYGTFAHSNERNYRAA